MLLGKLILYTLFVVIVESSLKLLAVLNAIAFITPSETFGF